MKSVLAYKTNMTRDEEWNGPMPESGSSKQIIAEFRKKFGCCDGTDKHATCQCYSQLKWLRTTIERVRQERGKEIAEKVREKYQVSESYEPPDNCQRENCTSCPEMRGRANGYRRALTDILEMLTKHT